MKLNIVRNPHFYLNLRVNKIDQNLKLSIQSPLFTFVKNLINSVKKLFITNRQIK